MSNGDVVSMYGSDVESAVQNYNQKVSEFENASKDINSAAENLMATWKGQGSQAFDAAVQKWQHDMQLISSDLQAIAETMTKAHIAITDTDNQIAKAFQGFN